MDDSYIIVLQIATSYHFALPHFNAGKYDGNEKCCWLIFNEGTRDVPMWVSGIGSIHPYLQYRFG